MDGEPQKIALFIDADNVSSRYGKLIMDNLEKRGEVFIRRIYGNWEKTAIRKWDDFILCYGLRTVHQIDFVTGKNATDMTLAIDAMDVLHKNPDVKTFAIVSNDSDFTPLAVRLREYGVNLIGIGMRDSSFSFKSACSEFISIESLGANKVAENKLPAESQVAQEVKLSDSEEKILALERKIAELELRISSPQLNAALRMTTEENKNSALKGLTGKIKQKIICKTFMPPIVEEEKPPEIVAEPIKKMEPSKKDVAVEIVQIQPPSVEMPTDIKGVVVFKPAASVNLQVEQPAQVAKKKVEVELQTNIQPPPAQTADTAAVADPQAVERAKALNLRLSQCGQKGMKNPKKKMQQIHDVLQESARLHGDKDGFVPLTFAGQDLKKKNLGFGIKDFGYMFLNEFISDFPDLYELTHNKPRSFRYRCV